MSRAGKRDWEAFPENQPLSVGELRFRAQARRILEEYARPQVRADCIDSPRPCPWVGCRQHLGLYITEMGALRLMHKWDDGRPTCALDEADQGGAILDDVAETFHVTRERVRQIEAKALKVVAEGIRDWLG
jgi:Sigma-70, region 4